MNIPEIETFVWTVRLGGVGAAARYLNITQPAATRRLQELERVLGEKLFRQEGRQLAPTAIGRACFSIAERILQEAANMRLVASGGAAVEGVVRVGVGEAIAVTWMHRWLQRVEASFPRLSLELDIDLSNRLTGKLARRQLELALVPGPVTLAGVVTLPLGSCSLRWLVRPGLVDTANPVTPETLGNAPIVTPSQDANSYAMMENWFASAEVRPRRLSHCNSLSALASLVRNGVGASLLPEMLFRRAIADGSVIALQEEPRVPRMEYWAAYLPAVEQAAIPQIAGFAREESWFLRPDDSVDWSESRQS